MGNLPGGIVIGVIGRFSPEKAPDRFLRVFSRATRDLPALRAVMIGEGPLLEDCRAQARALGCADRVVFAGWRTDLASIYKALDLLVIPSRSEGLPTVLLEAMLLGVPVVATSVGAVPDVVRDGQTALVVPEDDEEALQGAIELLASDRALRQRLAKAARKLAGERLTVEERARTILEHAHCLIGAGQLPEASEW